MKKYALMSVHSGKLKTGLNTLSYISEIKDDKLFLFPTKKDAVHFIKKNKFWALIPIAVHKNSLDVWQFSSNH